MQAMMLANGSPTEMADTDLMAGMDIRTPANGTEVPIPPDGWINCCISVSGRYRIFIQMKHATTVETGVFDADVR